jgi:DNA-binding NtrC family response regulator
VVFATRGPVGRTRVGGWRTVACDVLYVEDDRRIADVVEATLRDEGFAVTVAASAVEAFAHLATHAVDVILFDLRMRGMDGREFYELIRERGVSAPAVLVSAWSDIEAIAQALGVPFLRKPFELDELIAIVREACAPAS